MHVRRRWVLAAAPAVVALVVAWVPGAATASPAAASRPAAAGAPVVVTTATSPSGASVLVTGSGQALYVFSGDNEPFSVINPTPFQLDCTSLNVSPTTNQTCTTLYPPLLASSFPVAQGGVSQANLSTITRNGITQVIYHGKPLYTFVGDTAPGQFNADNRGDFRGMFWLDSTSGAPVTSRLTINTESSSFGTVLTAPNAGGAFRSVFSITAEAPGEIDCTAVCEAVWPPVLSGGAAIAGPGVNQALLGLITRPDRSTQVTYRGHPLYYFERDVQSGTASGSTDGEYFIDPQIGGVWYLLNPAGQLDSGQSTIGSQTVTTPSGNVFQLLDLTSSDETVTLYAFSSDTPASSACTSSDCQQTFPPVITSGPPAASGNANGSLLGTIQRPDGTFQVTYDGHPLYFDSQALDTGTSGEGQEAFGGTFKVVQTSGATGICTEQCDG